MELEVQEPTFSINGGGGAGYGSQDIVHISLFSSSTLKNRVAFSRLKSPIFRTHLTWKSCREHLTKTLLKSMLDIPATFFNGRGCDMVQKLSRMLRDSTIKRHGVHTYYCCVFIMVSKDSCWYNVVDSSCFFHGDAQFPSCEFVESLACESGVYSLPAGAEVIERSKARDDIEDNCAICLQGFPYGSEVARLPCSHVYHCSCVLEWFVQRGTCPLCRFPCSHA